MIYIFKDNRAHGYGYQFFFFLFIFTFRDQMRETFSTTMDTTTTLTGRKGYFVTRKNLFIFSGIVCCCLIATAIIMYNIKSCTDSCHNRIDESKQCAQTFVSDGIIMAASTTHSTGAMQNNTITDDEESDEEENNNNTTDTPETKPVNLRLPRSTIPKSYEIKLIPFLIEDNFTFIGEVHILVEIVEACKNITLHSMDLTINQVNLYFLNSTTTTNNTKESIQIKRKRHDIPKQFYIIETDTLLLKGFYLLHFKYNGILNDDLQGFYRSSYMWGKEKRWLATTQFQPTFFRHAVPSFDEPALKAKFKISIARPSHMVSLSNMPKIGSVNL